MKVPAFEVAIGVILAACGGPPQGATGSAASGTTTNGSNGSTTSGGSNGTPTTSGGCGTCRFGVACAAGLCQCDPARCTGNLTCKDESVRQRRPSSRGQLAQRLLSQLYTGRRREQQFCLRSTELDNAHLVALFVGTPEQPEDSPFHQFHSPSSRH